MFCSLIRIGRADPKSIFGHFSAWLQRRRSQRIAGLGINQQPSFDSYLRFVSVCAVKRPAQRQRKTRDAAEHNLCKFFYKCSKLGLGWHGDTTGTKKSPNWKLERQFTVDLLISKQAHLREYDIFERATLESFSEPSGFTD